MQHYIQVSKEAYILEENCTNMWPDHDGQWNDIPCDYRPINGYICKKPAKGGWTTPKPTQPPTGYCPGPEFRQFFGTPLKRSLVIIFELPPA